MRQRIPWEDCCVACAIKSRLVTFGGGELLPLLLGAYIELSFWCGEQDCRGWLPPLLRELIRLRKVCKLWQIAVDEYLTGLRGAALTDYLQHEQGYSITHINLRYCFVAVCHGKHTFETPLEGVCGDGGVPFREYVVSGEPLGFDCDDDRDDDRERGRIRIAEKSFSRSALIAAHALQDPDMEVFVHFVRGQEHCIHAVDSHVNILSSRGTLHRMPIPDAVFDAIDYASDLALCEMNSAHWVCLHTTSMWVGHSYWFLNPRTGRVARVEGKWGCNYWFRALHVLEDSDELIKVRIASDGVVHDRTIVADDHPKPPEDAAKASCFELQGDIPQQVLPNWMPVFQGIDRLDLVLANGIIVRGLQTPMVGAPILANDKIYDVLQLVPLPQVGPARLIARYGVVARGQAFVLGTDVCALTDGYVECNASYTRDLGMGASSEVRMVFNTLTGEIVLQNEAPAYWVRLF